MSRDDTIEVEGKVLDNLPQGKFKVVYASPTFKI